MKTVLIQNLCFPQTGTLTWEGSAAVSDGEELYDGLLVSDDRQHRYPSYMEHVEVLKAGLLVARGRKPL